MPTIFVSATSIVNTPNDSNDGLDIFGLQVFVDTPSYTAATRTLVDSGFVGSIPDLTGCWIGVTGGTGWTAGLYQIESCDPLTGTLVFKNAAGVNTSTNDIPTLSDGPVLTLAGAIAKFPATPTGPWTSYAANAAVRMCIANVAGLSSTTGNWQLNTYGTAAYHHRVCAADITTGQPEPTGQFATIQPTETFPMAGAGPFTPNTPLVQLVTGTSGYYFDFANIIFNGTNDGRSATHCFDCNTANGDITFTNCRFTNAGASGNGLRVVSQRIQLTRCRFDTNATHGLYATSSSLNSLRVFNCESFSNSFDGFNMEGTSEGGTLVECLSHNNSRHGFQFASSNRSTLVHHCVAANNAQHGFDLSSGVDLCLRGNVSCNNGTTSSHRQFNFGTTTRGTRTLTVDGNLAFAAGSTVVTDATDLDSSQLTTASASPIRILAASTFDGRLLPALRRTQRLVTENIGAGVTQTNPPGLSIVDPPGSSGDQRVLLRP